MATLVAALTINEWQAAKRNRWEGKNVKELGDCEKGMKVVCILGEGHSPCRPEPGSWPGGNGQTWLVAASD